MATIPAAEHLQLSDDAGGIRIPLEINCNDKGCLFAGSIYAGAMLAAYRAAEQRCARDRLDGNLVAKDASIRYLKPVTSDGHAAVSSCTEPLLKPNGNRTLTVVAVVADAHGTPCAEVTAELILLAHRPKATR
jgi:thioesterase domain-containing protein